jgi:release factor glutamine methyltransferase
MEDVVAIVPMNVRPSWIGKRMPRDPEQHAAQPLAVTEMTWTLLPDTTVGRAVNSATHRLAGTGSDEARLDAQVLLAHVLGVDRSWLFAHHDYALTSHEAERYTELIARRIALEPVAYLVGRREFYGIDLLVDRRVLIPRPETEMLVDAVLGHAEAAAPQLLRVADVGTGSGALALAVASHAPNVHVYAIDLSPDALAVALMNTTRLGLGERVTLLHGDLLAPLAESSSPKPLDVVVANLPYVNSRDYLTLQADVRNYEPKSALDGGPQGLDLIDRLLRQVPRVLAPGGLIVLEIAYDQGEPILDLISRRLPQAQEVDLRQDYQGRDRMVTFSV